MLCMHHGVQLFNLLREAFPLRHFRNAVASLLEHGHFIKLIISSYYCDTVGSDADTLRVHKSHPTVCLNCVALPEPANKLQRDPKSGFVCRKKNHASLVKYKRKHEYNRTRIARPSFNKSLGLITQTERAAYF